MTIERTAPAGRTALYARACGFSARESQLLTLLVAGADTRSVAAQMFVSELTVQDHLKSVFDKSGRSSIDMQGVLSTQPSTAVLDREGRVAAVVQGVVTESTLTGLVDDVLAEGAKG